MAKIEKESGDIAKDGLSNAATQKPQRQSVSFELNKSTFVIAIITSLIVGVLGGLVAGTQLASNSNSSQSNDMRQMQRMPGGGGGMGMDGERPDDANGGPGGQPQEQGDDDAADSSNNEG